MIFKRKRPYRKTNTAKIVCLRDLFLMTFTTLQLLLGTQFYIFYNQRSNYKFI